MNALAWGSLGIALLVVEMMTGTFILLFFGVSAIVVALSRLAGLDNWTIEVVIFGVVGMLGLLTMRKKLKASLNSPDSYVHEQSLRLTAGIAGHGEGKADYQGSPWTVVNTTGDDLKAGQKVQVVKTEGNKLFVKPE